MMIDDRPPALWRVEHGHALTGLRRLAPKRFQVTITSPPYFGLRDYEVDESEWDEVTYELPGGEITVPAMSSCLGLESTPFEYVGHLVEVFREVERVLRDDGLLWIVIGDSYNADGRKGRAHMGEGKNSGYSAWVNKTCEGTKPKDLLGIPWLLAFALRADGWYLRSDIIWAKPNPMPGSQRDRCTSSHEYVFMLSKRERYFYDDVAIREPFTDSRNGRDGSALTRERNRGGRTDGYTKPNGIDPSQNGGRTKRDIWTVATKPFPAAHFAVFPEGLIKPMILASTSVRACDECGAPWRAITEQRLSSTCEHESDQGYCAVLDPFAGAGTTGKVAIGLGRNFLGLELSPKYVEMARNRIGESAPINSVPDPHGMLLSV